MVNETKVAARLKDSPLFWNKVNKTDTCWLWTGCLNHRGYGAYGRFKAHRIVHLMFGGSFAPGYETDHLCRVHNCVNPKHIEAVPKRVNILRGESFSAKNAAKTQCPYGHPYGLSGGRRSCLECRKESNKRVAARRKRERQLKRAI